MRHRTLGLLIAVIVVMGLVACGDDDPGSDAAPGTTDAAGAPSAGSDGGPTSPDAGAANADDPTGAEGAEGAEDTGTPDGSAAPPPTFAVDAGKAAAATANARLLYSDVLPEGAMADVIDRLLGAACPIATDESLAPAAAADAIVATVPTDAGPPRSVPALIMVVGRYVVDGGCGTSPHLDLVADELQAQLGTAMAEHR